MNYRTRKGFAIDVGFRVTGENVCEAIALTNDILGGLPASLYRSLDFKTVSSIVGSIFCDALASRTEAIVNPIEKGHPDLVPAQAASATEAVLRNFPQGLEIKCTVGNVEQGANLRAGVRRLDKLKSITWQAHHREVESLMGLVWDFANDHDSFKHPAITAAFYEDDLEEADWGKISGTTGRNTKVCGMTASGKQKMGRGWVVVLDEPEYLAGFEKILGCDFS